MFRASSKVSSTMGEQTLPPPVSFSNPPTQAKESRLRVHWARIKKRISPGSAPSESWGETELTTEASSSGRLTRAAALAGEEDGPEDEEVEHVVVDHVFLPNGEKGSTQASEAVNSPEKSSHQHGSYTDKESLAVTHPSNTFWDRNVVLTVIRWRIWPSIKSFTDQSFEDHEFEGHYTKDQWMTAKPLALAASAWLILNWILACFLVPRPLVLFDKLFYFCLSPLLTVPIVFLILFNIPRQQPVLYQTLITISVWSWSMFNTLSLYLCGFYGSHSFWTCGNKDFLTLFYYSTAPPTIGLFALGQKRGPALIGAIIWVGLVSGLVLPLRHSLARSLINNACYHLFILYIHRTREATERRIYQLQDKIKHAYKEAASSRRNEQKTAQSKRRLTSYVFHEVRVPLNTCLLAFQNLAASGVITKDQSVEFNALEGGLSMMSKVLNDVLDFNRMDSGKFESVAKPYHFHAVIKSLLVPLKLAADARGLALITNVDSAIDHAARTATYQAQGKDEAFINRALAEEEEDGLVVGDEMRLRQILTNLTSNACKFTHAGGRIHLRTKLIYPTKDDPRPWTAKISGGETTGFPKPTVVPHLKRQASVNSNKHHSGTLESIVVRIEVQDTGVGIRPRDLVNNRLFSPYVQTEIGRYQGGKGTGLGLALCEHIVKLSGGRLGVKTKLGEGSTFWVELALGVGKRALSSNPESSVGKSNRPPSLGQERDGFVVDVTGTTVQGFQPPEGEGATPSSIVPPSISSEAGMSPETGYLPTLPPQSDSALKSIMEHGGLVELVVPRRPPEDEVRVVVAKSVTSTPSDRQGDITTDVSTVSTRQARSGDRPSYVSMPEPNPMFQSSVTSSGTTSSSAVSHPLSSDRPQSSSPPLRVLVVDDDLVTRQLMSRMLRRLGCIVETAENGQMALQMIVAPPQTPGTQVPTPTSITAPSLPPSPMRANTEERRFAVVFLDNQMPIMSGVEMTRELRKRGRRDFLVGVTGNALKEDQTEYLDAGVDHVLTKPVLERSLKAMLTMAQDYLKSKHSKAPP